MHEQRSFWAAIVTIVMWVAVTAISVVFMVFENSNASALGVAAFVLLMAAFGVGGTTAVWASGQSATPQAVRPPVDRRSARKVKRAASGDMARLVDSLDEDQIIELETLLLTREDELDYE